MAIDIRRREFVFSLGGAAAAWPLAAHAQQPAMPVIGYLSATSLDRYTSPLVAAFHHGLTESGFIEGRNVAIEYRWAEGHYDRLPALATELVNLRVAVLFAGALPAALAAKQVTSTIPVVFVMGADPVKLGVVASLNRPGGNLTGICQLHGALGGKRLEIIRELVPSLAVLAVLSNPKNPNADDHLNEIEAAAHSIGQQIDVIRASSEADIDVAFTSLARHRDSALLVADDPLFSVHRDKIVALAARHRVPTSYYVREFVLAGGLTSYGSSGSDNNRQAGIYVGRILKGAKPADLPVMQPTKFELVINLKTARTLGLEVPPTLLARADEVIE
jgi:putative ABC transport system substrate-binding protein